MTHYRQDERGRLFRWDTGLRAWFRIVSHDDEYEVASLAVRTERAWSEASASSRTRVGAGSAAAPTSHPARGPVKQTPVR